MNEDREVEELVVRKEGDEGFRTYHQSQTNYKTLRCCANCNEA